MNNLQNLSKVATVSMVLLLPFLAGACSGLQVSAKCEAGQQDGKEHWSCEVTASKEFWIWDGSWCTRSSDNWQNESADWAYT